jgi:hypothetical protein
LYKKETPLRTQCPEERRAGDAISSAVVMNIKVKT